MNTTAEKLYDAALELSEQQRAELIEALLASLQPSDRPPFDESWRAVIARRSAELQSGKVKTVPWEDVKRNAREQGVG